jgi:uncharacterized membrane protein
VSVSPIDDPRDPRDPRDAADRRLAARIARLLRVGVLLSAVVTLAGGALLLLDRGGAPANLAAFPRPTAPPSDLLAILRGALALEPRALTQLGVVLLIATPVARVALTFVDFARRRDRAYVVLTGLVLLLLVGGVVLG